MYLVLSCHVHLFRTTARFSLLPFLPSPAPLQVLIVQHVLQVQPFCRGHLRCRPPVLGLWVVCVCVCVDAARGVCFNASMDGIYLKDLLHGADRQPARPNGMQRPDHVADLEHGMGINWLLSLRRVPSIHPPPGASYHVVEEGLGPDVHLEQLAVAAARVQQVCSYTGNQRILMTVIRLFMCRVCRACVCERQTPS